MKIARAVEPAARLTVTANGCTVYDGVVPHEEWETTLPLAPCRLAGDELTIRLVTTVPPRPGEEPSRAQGVAVRSLHLLSEGPTSRTGTH